ncbi:MAG: OmpH family outer membrane protein [Akkermansiaceae bacterium]
MKFLFGLIWLSLTLTCFGKDKYGVVKVTDIYRKLPSTAAMQERLKERRSAILDNRRAESFRKIITEMQGVQAEIQKAQGDGDRRFAQKIIREYEIKRQEAETMRQEFEDYRAEQKKKIDAQLVVEMRTNLNRIAAASAQIAKERNLDGVFDTSGSTNTGVPFVLYSKDAEDLTEDVLNLLIQEDERAAEIEKAEQEKIEQEEVESQPAEETVNADENIEQEE